MKSYKLFKEGEEIGKMLNGLISKLEGRIPNNPTLNPKY